MRASLFPVKTVAAAQLKLAATLAPDLAREAAALGLPASGLPARSYVLQVQAPLPPQAGSAAAEALPPPLDDPDELVQLLTQLMEDASDALAVERAVAGAVRLCVLPGGERARLAGPLLKRAERRLREDYDGPFSGHEIVADVAALTVAWATGQVPDTDAAVRPWGSEERETVLRSGRARTMAGILTARIREACTLVADGRPSGSWPNRSSVPARSAPAVSSTASAPGPAGTCPGTTWRRRCSG